jgi:hypothetical protein
MEKKMKHAKFWAFALVVAAVSTTGLRAEGSYVGFGLGIQFNLASLGETIVNDGLESTGGGPGPNLRSNNGVGGSTCVITNNCPADIYATSNQKIIVDEKTLVAYEKLSFGAMRVKTGGPMTGATLKAFYEKETAGGVFFRGGLQLTRKVRGGDTRSTVAGIEWYSVQWDYSALSVPLYAGFKAGVSENVSVYMGGGVNYTKGFFQLSGTNVGVLPTALFTRFLSTSVGLVPTVGAANTNFPSTATGSSVSNSGIIGERAKFKAEGLGFNFVTGIEKKLESGDKLFFEIEQIVAGGIGRRGLTSAGAISAFAPVAAYPVNLSGTHYTFGYKMSM